MVLQPHAAGPYATSTCRNSRPRRSITSAQGDFLLNLIHYQPGHQADAAAIPAIERVHPLSNIRCEVKAPGAGRVTLEPEGRELEFEVSDGYVRFIVPELEHLAIVRIALP